MQWMQGIPVLGCCSLLVPLHNTLVSLNILDNPFDAQDLDHMCQQLSMLTVRCSSFEGRERLEQSSHVCCQFLKLLLPTSGQPTLLHVAPSLLLPHPLVRHSCTHL